MNLDVLAFFAHPDDETMLCGGTLALLARQGARVHLLIATRGEGGELGEPALCAREELGQVRENELRCAANALGAASLSVMNYHDPLVGPGDELFPFTDNLEKLASEVVESARRCGAGAILAHGVNGEYGHPAHVLVYQAASLAVDKMEEKPLFYTIQGTFPGHPYPRLANQDSPAHMIINIAPILEVKIAAAMCHRTQHALFTRHGSERIGRSVSVAEVVLPVESLHRVYPGATANGKIHDALADLLWSSGLALPVPVE